MNQQAIGTDNHEIIKVVRSYQQTITFMKLISGVSLLLIMILPIGILRLVEGKVQGLLLLAMGIAAIPVAIIVISLQGKQKKKLKVYIGEHIIKNVIAEKINIIQYSPDKWINEDFVRKCKILPSCTKIRGSDYIKGTYKGVPLVYCDLKLDEEYETTDSDGNSTTEHETVFQGHLINLELGREIDGYVRIQKKKTPRNKKGLLPNILGSTVDLIGGKNNTIEVENVEFNNQFKIKTNNAEMAFYILTPQFMENIMHANQLAGGRTNIEFMGKTATITIDNGKDSFEVTKAMRNVKTLENSRQQMRKDLDIILSIIDEILAKDRLF